MRQFCNHLYFLVTILNVINQRFKQKNLTLLYSCVTLSVSAPRRKAQHPTSQLESVDTGTTYKI
jgi:hypothetical protein